MPFPDNSIDKIITDAPFGQTHTVKTDLFYFYRKLLAEVIRYCSFKTCRKMSVIIKPPKNECFRGYTGISLSVSVSVCVQNTSFCLSTGRGIRSFKLKEIQSTQ